MLSGLRDPFSMPVHGSSDRRVMHFTLRVSLLIESTETYIAQNKTVTRRSTVFSTTTELPGTTLVVSNLTQINCKARYSKPGWLSKMLTHIPAIVANTTTTLSGTHTQTLDPNIITLLTDTTTTDGKTSNK